jgi:integrase/recombinase XerD
VLDRRARGHSKDTIRFYRDKLGHFARWAGDRPLDELNPTLLKTYLVHLADRRLAPWTIHGAARSLRTFSRWLVDEGLLDKALMPAMPKRPRAILPPFTVDEAHRLLDAADHSRDKALLLVLLDSGLRVAEAARLEGRDVDLSSGRVVVRSGKGAKPRVTYLGAHARAALGDYFDESGAPAAGDAVFRTLRGASKLALNLTTIQRSIRRLGRAAGVDNATPHRCRRTFALWCLRAGMDLFSLQRLMGHEDIVTLRSYLALVEDDVEAAHRAAAPLDRLLK